MSTSAATPISKSVDASPVKLFFVDMLTRDIKLEEAILDLLDNCIDGVLRGKRTKGDKPYQGYWCRIQFGQDSFSITDNCGGIPWDLLDYALRMGPAPGRPPGPPGSVGVYGIGMKRAIFKMGRHCLITTRHLGHSYEIEIKPKWLEDENTWELPVRPTRKKMTQDGTFIAVTQLNNSISARFNREEKAFTSELQRMIGTYYAFIMNKGFEVWINDQPVVPRPTRLVFSKKLGVLPFIYKATINGITVFLAVGFTRPIPTEAEVSDAQEETRYSSIDAGWTVVCNDRAVLYCDRTELTGWGEAGVPRYHNQFIAISGIVEFRSNDASKLPTTTTKHGIDASSTLYLQVKNKMREGLRLFIDYTNKWKSRTTESKKHIEKQPLLTFTEIKKEAKQLKFSSTRRSIPKGEQYKPDLPLPGRTHSRKRRISFEKDAGQVSRLALYLFNDENADPSVVGEKCFDLMLEEAE
jgi:hypothetical protein